MMVLPGVSDAVQAIEGNSGHPFLSLWAASGPTVPLVVAVLPGWFNSGSGMIAYVPGEPHRAAVVRKMSTTAVLPLQRHS